MLFGHLVIGILQLVIGIRQEKETMCNRRLVIGQTKVSVLFLDRVEFLDRLKFLDRVEFLDRLECLDRPEYLDRMECFDILECPYRLECFDSMECLDRL